MQGALGLSSLEEIGESKPKKRGGHAKVADGPWLLSGFGPLVFLELPQNATDPEMLLVVVYAFFFKLGMGL